MKDRKMREARHPLLRGVAVLSLLVFAALAAGRGLTAWQRWRYAGQGLQIAPVFQYDYPETVCQISGENKSVATSGCGAACMSMVITYLTGETEQTPQTLFADAYASGDYTGSGLSHEALDHLGEQHGVMGVWIGRDEARLRTALERGHPVIAHMGPGAFTNEGHYILLRGLADDGRVLLNDPSSESRTWKTWELSRILREAKGNTPFMVCRRSPPDY